MINLNPFLSLARLAKKNFQLQMYNQPRNNNNLHREDIINKNPVAVKYSDNEVCSGGFVLNLLLEGSSFNYRIESNRNRAENS